MKRWEALERWSPRAFLIAGGLMAVFWALVSLEVFMDVSSPQALLAMPALVATVVGLMGLYPRVSDSTPMLAKLGSGLLGLALIGIVVIFLWVLASDVLTTVSGVKIPNQPPGIFKFSTIGAYATSVLVFGIAYLQSGSHSRRVGLLLLALVGVFGIPVVAGIVWGDYPGEWMAVVVSGLQALAMLAIGFALRTEPTVAGGAGSPADSPT